MSKNKGDDTPKVFPGTLRGNVDKGSTDYLEAIKKNTKYPTHPRHFDIRMQAHHLVSQKGIELGNFGSRLADLGYEINELNNLVFIPYTLQGACMLGIQPHRGNHTARDPGDDDRNRDPSYHERVRDAVKVALGKLNRVCGEPTIKLQTQAAMDAISALFAYRIQNKPSEAKLTALWEFFEPGHVRGCGGVDSVGDRRAVGVCPVGRNHTQRKGPLQGDENITYVPTGRYVLRPGH